MRAFAVRTASSRFPPLRSAGAARTRGAPHARPTFARTPGTGGRRHASLSRRQHTVLAISLHPAPQRPRPAPRQAGPGGCAAAVRPARRRCVGRRPSSSFLFITTSSFRLLLLSVQVSLALSLPDVCTACRRTSAAGECLSPLGVLNLNKRKCRHRPRPMASVCLRTHACGRRNKRRPTTMWGWPAATGAACWWLRGGAGAAQALGFAVRCWVLDLFNHPRRVCVGGVPPESCAVVFPVPVALGGCPLVSCNCPSTERSAGTSSHACSGKVPTVWADCTDSPTTSCGGADGSTLPHCGRVQAGPPPRSPRPFAKPSGRPDRKRSQSCRPSTSNRKTLGSCSELCASSLVGSAMASAVCCAAGEPVSNALQPSGAFVDVPSAQPNGLKAYVAGDISNASKAAIIFCFDLWGVGQEGLPQVGPSRCTHYRCTLMPRSLARLWTGAAGALEDR